MAEGIGNAVFWVNRLEPHGVLYVSPAYRRLWGLDPAALYADPTSHRRLVHPDDRERVETAYATGAAAGRFDEEYRMVLPSGDVRWIRDRGYPIPTPSSSARIAGIAEDITDRKRRDERLIGIQAMTAALAGAVRPEQVARIVVDHARALLGAERGVVARFSGNPRALIPLAFDGAPADLASADGRLTLDPTTLFDDAIARGGPVVVATPTDGSVRRGNASPPIAVVGAAAVPLVVDGRTIGAIGFAFPGNRPFSTEDRAMLGAVADLCAQSLDRARLFDAERASRLRAEAAEARFRATFEQAAVGVAHVALDGRWLRVNRALLDIVGYAEADLLTRTWQDVTYGPDLPADLEHVRRLVADEIPSFSTEKRYVRPDGSLTWAQVTPTIARPATEAPYIIKVIEDISERKALERVQEEFLASVSHDLKNPLGAIKGRAQVMGRRLRRDGALDPGRLASGLAAIDQGATRMSALIDELGDAVRLRAGQPLDLRLGPTDLVALVRRVADDYGRTTERHRVRVETAQASLVGVWDERRLERVLANLLSNAIKYSPDGGEIVVAIARDGGDGSGSVRVSVADHGVGIPAADLPRLFERYRRGANVGGIAGTGVGLFGARRIVRQHGGTMAVDSTEDDGTTVTVRLPLDSSPA